jgi:hypothetical protein
MGRGLAWFRSLALEARSRGFESHRPDLTTEYTRACGGMVYTLVLETSAARYESSNLSGRTVVEAEALALRM